MYKQKANGPSSVHGEDKKTAQETRTSKSPTYIGFRVTR